MTHNPQKGFTLVEMLTVLAIFAILTGITVFNYNQFRSDTILTNMAYEVALSIREAQIYGVSARGTNNTTPDFETAHGVYFKENTGQYILFADTGSSDYEFSGTNCANPGGDTCVTSYTMQQQVLISDISTPNGNSNICAPKNGVTDASILFKRPNPEPIITRQGANDPNYIQLKITSQTGASRYVLVYNNGQISVTNQPECN